MIEYRKALYDDWKVIANLRVVFLDEISGKLTDEEIETLTKNNEDYMKETLANNTFISWLAISNEEIVGTSGLSLFYFPPSKIGMNGRNGYISNMYVIEKFRGKGIANNLFKMIVDESKKNNCSRLFLGATEMGRPIYEKFGFTNLENEMVYYNVLQGKEQ